MVRGCSTLLRGSICSLIECGEVESRPKPNLARRARPRMRRSPRPRTRSGCRRRAPRRAWWRQRRSYGGVTAGLRQLWADRGTASRHGPATPRASRAMERRAAKGQGPAAGPPATREAAACEAHVACRGAARAVQRRRQGGAGAPPGWSGVAARAVAEAVPGQWRRRRYWCCSLMSTGVAGRVAFHDARPVALAVARGVPTACRVLRGGRLQAVPALHACGY